MLSCAASSKGTLTVLLFGMQGKLKRYCIRCPTMYGLVLLYDLRGYCELYDGERKIKGLQYFALSTVQVLAMC